jgi:hypothetical protein
MRSRTFSSVDENVKSALLYPHPCEKPAGEVVSNGLIVDGKYVHAYKEPGDFRAMHFIS